jgi:hypothetical protein
LATHAVANRVRPAGPWKGYNVAFAASASPEPNYEVAADDETIAYPTYAIIDQNKGQLRKHPGFFNICIHKVCQQMERNPSVRTTCRISGTPTTS